MNLTTLKLSWRNIWRNHRRTLITMSSVFFAVFFSIIMMSFSNGSWDRMIENMLRTQTGHVQIHQKGYWNDKVIDNFMTMDSATLKRLGTIEHITNMSPRVETFALASAAKLTKGIAVVGVDPECENQKSSLAKRLKAGNYLAQNDQGILIGKGLSEYLQVNVGDTLALIGQGYHGASAAGLFPVRGIVSLITPEMDKGLVYMSLPAAQAFIDMPDGYSGILISIDNSRNLKETLSAVTSAVDTSKYEVLSWKVTMEALMSQSQSDKAFSKIILFVLYLIVGFGILGTVIMMTNERRREFAMLISLGMQRGRLAKSVVLELLMLTLAGTFAALVVTIPIVVYFSRHPIPLTGEMATTMLEYGMEAVLPMSAAASIFVTQAIVVILITTLTVIYPIRVIRKLKTTNR